MRRIVAGGAPTSAAGPVAIMVASVAATTAIGFILRNPTPADAVTTVQRSPSLVISGSAWDTNDTTSRTFGMAWQVRPVSGTTVTGELELMTELDGVLADAGFAVGDGYFRFGVANLPTSGRMRFPHNNTILGGALSGGSTNVNLLTWGTGGQTNGLTFGAAGVAALRFNAVDGATTGLYIDGTEVQYGRAIMRYGAAIASPVFSHEDRGASGAVTNLAIRAQGTSQASTAGGLLRLEGGRAGSGGTPGQVALFGNVDNSTFHEGFRVGSSGSAAQIGFYGATPAVKPAVTGSRGGNAALADLLTDLATLGLITDSTSA